ncbi:putative reverse transcriptase domain-containing protein, partial [Tanacetum coccineum]
MQRKRVRPIPARRLAWRSVSHHSSDRYSSPNSSSSSSPSYHSVSGHTPPMLIHLHYRDLFIDHLLGLYDVVRHLDVGARGLERFNSTKDSGEEHMEVDTADAEVVADVGISEGVVAHPEDGVEVRIEKITKIETIKDSVRDKSVVASERAIWRSFRQVEGIRDDTRRRLRSWSQALAAHEATRTANALEAENQSQNGSDSDNGNGGNGNGKNGNGGNGNPNENGRGDRPVARKCTYQDFMKCQPLNFKGTEGVNNDLAAYTQRFQELTMMCNKMVPEEEDQVEKFIGGLPDNILWNVIAAEPTRLQDAVRITNNLMDQKQQPPFKRPNVGGQNVARAYTTGNNEKKTYNGPFPLCNKCKLHYEGPCTVRCGKCNMVGHLTRDCKVTNSTTSTQRGQVVNQRVLTCFECGRQGHFRSDCPKLKDQNCGNKAGNKNGVSEARGKANVLGGGEANPDS